MTTAQQIEKRVQTHRWRKVMLLSGRFRAAWYEYKATITHPQTHNLAFKVEFMFVRMLNN